MLYRFAVCLSPTPELPGTAWIEFYWAEDAEHAWEQAIDANPDAISIAVGVDPDAPPRSLAGSSQPRRNREHPSRLACPANFG